MADRKKARKPSVLQLSYEEKLARSIRAKRRFKALIRLTIANLYWLEEIGDVDLGDNIAINIKLLTRKKDRISLLTIIEKSILNKPAQFRTKEEKEILYKSIGGLKCFRIYPAHVKTMLAAVTYFKYFGPGRVIVRQGHQGLGLYFIITGEVQVSQTVYDPVIQENFTKIIGTMTAGSAFGEVALLHGIGRTATITTLTHCELLFLGKSDFDVVLKDSLQKQWDEIQYQMSRFSYFDGWNDISVREFCINAKMKAYSADQTILGDGVGMQGSVYFVLKGKVRIVENLTVTTRLVNGIKKYKLYKPPPPEQRQSIALSAKEPYKIVTGSKKSASFSVIGKQPSRELSKKSLQSVVPIREPSTSLAQIQSRLSLPAISQTRLRSRVTIEEPDKALTAAEVAEPLDTYQRSALERRRSTKIELPPNAETHFMQVCILNETACFGIGENQNNRRYIAIAYTECMLIPRYWLMQKNKGNIWNRVKQYLDSHIPSTDDIFKEFVNNRKWMAHKKRMVDDIISQSRITNDNTYSNIPYFIRINEELR